MTDHTRQDLAFIRALAKLFSESDLTEIEVVREYGEDDELKVRLSRAVTAAPVVASAPAVMSAPVAAAPAPVATVPAAAAAPEQTAEPDLTGALRSPMVGTVYLSSEPGADPFVSVGDRVSEGETVLIIEAMKTMNQIPAPKSGVIRSILVDNAEPVEYGHPLILID